MPGMSDIVSMFQAIVEVSVDVDDPSQRTNSAVLADGATWRGFSGILRGTIRTFSEIFLELYLQSTTKTPRFQNSKKKTTNHHAISPLLLLLLMMMMMMFFLFNQEKSEK